MGKGRAPCCDKEKVKRGPWSPSEDLRLITFIQKHGHQNWSALPKQAGLLRCGKSCRLRWINYLRPEVKRGNFTKDEEDTIIRLHATLGNKWSKIALYLPGRTNNEIMWNTHLKKRLGSMNGNVDKKDESMATSSLSSCFTSMSSFNDKKPNEAFEMAVVSDKANHGSPSEEPEALSSSSMSSNVTNSNQVNVSNPEIQEGLLFDFTGCYYNTLEEVNKPETTFDIPLESDLEFWNMLDSLVLFQPEGIQSHNETQSPDFGEAENKWLLYLEQELGLDPKDGGFEAEPLLVPEMNGMGTMCHYPNTVQPYEPNSKQQLF